MAAGFKRETDLYGPVKQFLEAQGFTVKGEVGGCDLVAVREGEPPLLLVGELKLGFNLDLLLQGVDRLAAGDQVWLAVPATRGRGAREKDPRVRRLCRHLGLGLLAVGPGDIVEVLADPADALPRRDPKRKKRLLAEHRKRQGDPTGGGSSRAPILTAYRQQALACARALAAGPQAPKALKPDCPDAPKILANNVYGWFTRVSRGLYALTVEGEAALSRWPADPAPHVPARPSSAG